MQRRWTDQEILDALRAWADKHGRTPTWKDWHYAAPDRPTSMTVWVRCGSWRDALIMAGLQVPERSSHFVKKFSRPEARRLRRLGLNDAQIGRKLGVHGTTIGKALGPREEPPKKKPRTAAERREARIEALKKAISRDEADG
jgi:hypothetical protein